MTKERNTSLIDFYAERASWGSWNIALFLALGLVVFISTGSGPEPGVRLALCISGGAIFGFIFLVVCQLCCEIRRLERRLSAGDIPASGERGKTKS